MNRTEDAPPIERYLDYRAYIADWFAWKKAQSTRFSHRAFARRIGQKSPSLVVDLIAGRRHLTPALLRPFAKALGLHADGRHYLQLLVELDRASTPEERNSAFERVSAHRRFRTARPVEGESFRYLSDWACPAVRELAGRPDFRADAAWIAATLMPPITPTRAQRALDTLFELGLLVRTDDRVVQAEGAVVTPPEVQGLAVHNFHAGMLTLAHDAIRRFEPEERHLTGVTVCIPASTVPMVKQAINQFAEQILELCDGAEGDPERVYQIHLAAFPLSRPHEEPP